MVSVLGYLFNRFFYRLGEFLHHWYRGGFFFFFHRLVNLLERLDRFFALKINLRYLFKPLYQQYTFLGYVFGFIFRGIRIAIAGFIYGLVVLMFLVLYSAWALIPIFILIKILS
jgi:hypothetical protein